jgi:hypothetical protein
MYPSHLHWNLKIYEALPKRGLARETPQVPASRVMFYDNDRNR